MKRKLGILALAALCGCDGTAWNSTVADNMAVRAQMAASVVSGTTTEMALITRWGRPVQKVRDGGQVEYIYRNMRAPGEKTIGPVGDSTRYVIVTFQYGIATAVRTSDTEICRATFAPRPPGHAYPNPSEVRPVRTCPGLYRPPVGEPVLPAVEAEGQVGVGHTNAVKGAGALSTPQASDAVGAGPEWPRADPIHDDVYLGDPSRGK